jgi:hypothetical protein
VATFSTLFSFQIKGGLARGPTAMTVVVCNLLGDDTTRKPSCNSNGETAIHPSSLSLAAIGNGIQQTVANCFSRNVVVPTYILTVRSSQIASGPPQCASYHNRSAFLTYLKTRMTISVACKKDGPPGELLFLEKAKCLRKENHH